ncbi:MAG: VOC family protein [Planctomycetota bacterium]
MRIECINPILNVADMTRSLDFYVGKLGFTNAEWGNENFTHVSRDGCGLYLCRGGQGQAGTWVWVGIEDARAVHDDLASQGVIIRQPPTNQPWALEVHVEDPDGHVLRLGSDPE